MTIKHQVQGRANKRRVHTPWGVIRNGKRIVSAFPKEKVSGDFRAVTSGRLPDLTIIAGGESVLVEVKSRPNRLQWSALEKHQVEALNEHAQYSDHTWLFFHDSETDTITKYRWPIHGYGPGKSLKQ